MAADGASILLGDLAALLDQNAKLEPKLEPLASKMLSMAVSLRDWEDALAKQQRNIDKQLSGLADPGATLTLLSRSASKETVSTSSGDSLANFRADVAFHSRSASKEMVSTPSGESIADLQSELAFHSRSASKETVSTRSGEVASSTESLDKNANCELEFELEQEAVDVDVLIARPKPLMQPTLVTQPDRAPPEQESREPAPQFVPFAEQLERWCYGRRNKGGEIFEVEVIVDAGLPSVCFRGRLRSDFGSEGGEEDEQVEEFHL